MPYSVAEFDESRQEAFIETVADAANVQSFRVTIVSITEAAGRRLLAQGCEVLFRVRVPRGEEEERAPPILEALSAVENMNARLEQRGLQPALRVVGPARIIRPQRNCAASPINGAHGPFPCTPSCVRLSFYSPQSLPAPEAVMLADARALHCCIGSSCAPVYILG
jgi:hypothetical protein